MNDRTDVPTVSESSRREFLARGSSLAALMSVIGGVELRAQDKPAEEKASFSLGVGLIGCGPHGRDILQTLNRLPAAKVLGVCDHFPAMLRRTTELVPGAKHFENYKDLLAQPDIKAVIIATPSHQHRQVVLDALAADKHVYCEAPLAHTIEDARAIAAAAKGNLKVNFQAGLQYRADAQRTFLLSFIRSGACGKFVKARAQWHKKNSWARTSGNADREKELNWRLRRATSPGLLGEMGIHQLDVMSWMLRMRPVAVTGFGGVMLWDDGRDVPDTAQVMVEYPGGVRFNYEATLTNSFDTDYEMIYGSEAAVMMRGSKAWMFREVDAPLLGWEVYARKDEFFNETGIALAANATKQAVGAAVAEPVPFKDTPLYYSLESFLTNSNTVGNGVEDFALSYDVKDTKALGDYIATLAKARMPAAGAAEGFEATALALKANEAVLGGKRIEITAEMLTL